ncbi:5-(carboxyamino)imidazole ribonucleotide mutase [Candidatus Curtissbacteria bacterium]|nr:5-(carboxyamino)imidazole ribonucleotide mutase [Candidatus Curtissbacteria bacterium]
MKQVAIIMGSDSDLPVMQEAAKILDEFSVSYQITVVSAHRTPDRMAEFAKDAEGNGTKVIIAGAGGAAHLPGMTAANTHLPVIGVPVKTKTMDGLDSVLSIVQMPPGVPVATVAINGAKNAGLLAVEILALSNKELSEKIKQYKANMKSEVLQKAQNLEKSGYKDYLEQSEKKDNV